MRATPGTTRRLRPRSRTTTLSIGSIWSLGTNYVAAPMPSTARPSTTGPSPTTARRSASTTLRCGVSRPRRLLWEQAETDLAMLISRSDPPRSEISGTWTPRAARPDARATTHAHLRISMNPSKDPTNAERYLSGAPRRTTTVSTIARSPTSTRRCRSIPRAPAPIPSRANAGRRRATALAPSPTTAKPFAATPTKRTICARLLPEWRRVGPCDRRLQRGHPSRTERTRPIREPWRRLGGEGRL